MLYKSLFVCLFMSSAWLCASNPPAASAQRVAAHRIKNEARVKKSASIVHKKTTPSLSISKLLVGLCVLLSATSSTNNHNHLCVEAGSYEDRMNYLTYNDYAGFMG